MKWFIRNVLLAPWRGLWMAVWDLCEFYHIDLGKVMAPWVFNQMLGCYKRTKYKTAKENK